MASNSSDSFWSATKIARRLNSSVCSRRNSSVFSGSFLRAKTSEATGLDFDTLAEVASAVSTQLALPSTYAPLSKVSAALRLDRVIAWDTFNRADGALGTSESGHTWEVLSGTWAIASNQATSTDGVFDTAAVIDPGEADVDVRAWMNYSGASRTGLVVRGIDSSNFLFVARRDTDFRILKLDAGSSTQLAAASVTATAADKGHLVRVRCVGNQIDAYLDDVRVTRHTLTGGDATKYGAATKVGLLSGNAGTRTYDSFVVEEA